MNLLSFRKKVSTIEEVPEMPHILDTLNNIRADDHDKFLRIRTKMRAVYLQAIHETVGMHNFIPEDDSFLDSIDIKVEMLMARAGIDTPSNKNDIPQKTNVSDVFALITRPLKPAKIVENVVNEIKEMTDDAR